jgi:hypothetical protein
MFVNIRPNYVPTVIYALFSTHEKGYASYANLLAA